MSRGSKSKREPLDCRKLYFSELNREFMPDLLKNDGDFLLRRGSDGGKVLSVNVNKKIQHFKFADNAKSYQIESMKFPSLDALLQYYYESGEVLSRGTKAVLRTPIYNSFEMIDEHRINFVQVLGKGNFGEVWKATLMPENEVVAVKIIGGNASDRDRSECMAEAKLMSLLDHDNVVRLKGLSFYSQGGGHLPRLLIGLEYCNYGSLDKLLEKGIVEDRGKLRALLDAARGLEYLHKRDIIHRDIASRNILVMQSGRKFTCKVADFGLSRLAPDHYELVTKRRLPVFAMSPESLKHRDWTSMSDVWAFGILIHEVYNGGRNPYETMFEGVNVKVLAEKLESGVRAPTNHMPREMADLVNRCLATKPHDRPKMSDVVAFLKELHDVTVRR